MNRSHALFAGIPSAPPAAHAARAVYAPSGRPPAAAVAMALLALAALGVGCAPPCETGERCARACPIGATGLCAAHGLCACVAEPTFGEGPLDVPGTPGTPSTPGAPGTPDEPAELGAPDTPGGADPEGDGSTRCVSPGPRAIVINELMLDGEQSEDAEFVELVNPGDQPVALAGVVLTSNRGASQVRRVAFIGGCLPAHGALAMFPDRASWIESAASPWPIEAELRSFGFANSGDFDFRLTAPDGAVIDQLAGAGDLITPGVSLNRDPDLLGTALAAHPTLDPAQLDASPGACPNGGRYASACAVPEVDVALPSDAPPVTEAAPPSAAFAEPPDPDAPAGNPADPTAPDPTGSREPGEPGEPAREARDATPDDPSAAGSDPPPPDCPLPEPGDLVIAEVLVDGLVPRTERDEFVELVNRTPLPRRLVGVGLGYEKQGGVDARVRFDDGCLPAHGAIIIRPRIEDWAFVPPPPEPITLQRAALALGNETRDPLLLVDADDAELTRFPLAGQPFVEGISLTRHPGLDGEPILHDRLGPRPTSPGTCPDGRAFGPDDCAAPALVACRPPEPGELLVDEVLVDGVEEAEADEFIELVNATDDPLSLGGVVVLTNRGESVAERVAFESGCLPAGALVALYADAGRWRWSVDEPSVVVDIGRFGFPNDTPFGLELRHGEMLLDAVRLPRALLTPGVSAVRAVHADPDAEFVRHDSVSPEPVSPGRRTDQTVFEVVR